MAISKKVCNVAVNVALAKLETTNEEQAPRLETLIYDAQSKMDGTIYKNGVASRLQREKVTETVWHLNKRLANHERVLSRMESGLRQMEELEERLIEIISVGKEISKQDWVFWKTL